MSFELRNDLLGDHKADADTLSVVLLGRPEVAKQLEQVLSPLLLDADSGVQHRNDNLVPGWMLLVDLVESLPLTHLKVIVTAGVGVLLILRAI